MTEHLHWAGPLVAWLVVTVINALLRNYRELPSSWVKLLRTVVDVLSVLTNRDSPGTLKPPIVRSRRPDALYLKRKLGLDKTPPSAPTAYGEPEEKATPVEVPR